MALKFHVYSTFGYVTWCFKRSTKALQRPLRLNLSLRNLRGAFSRWDLKSILQFDKQGTSLPRSLPLSLLSLFLLLSHSYPSITHFPSLPPTISPSLFISLSPVIPFSHPLSPSLSSTFFLLARCHIREIASCIRDATVMDRLTDRHIGRHIDLYTTADSKSFYPFSLSDHRPKP